MRRRTHLILGPVALFAACEGDPQPTTDIPVHVEDSAGVRLVEYAGTPAADTPFRFRAEPLYRHGNNPGDYAFQRIGFGRLFPDGSAVVSDGGNDELVVLSQDGKTHELLAGPGEGPGDLSYVNAVFVLGQDTVLATDIELLRATVFAGGALACRVWLPPYRPGRAREAPPDYTVIAADGEWLGRVEAPPEFRILDVADGLVLGVLRDEMSVQIVAAYELVAQ